MTMFPVSSGGFIAESTTAGASSRGVSVTGGAANTKGNWTQLLASSAFDASGIWIHLWKESATGGRAFLYDIGIGAAEQVLIPNILYDNPLILNGHDVFFPIAIPAGTKISARCQDSGGNGILNLKCQLYGQGFLPSAAYQNVFDIGVVTATSKGTTLTSGNPANTKGAYVELVASTANDAKLLGVNIGVNGTGAVDNNTWLVDMAIGTGGSEEITYPDFMWSGSSTHDCHAPMWFIVPADIPAGTRIAARTQASTANKTFTISMYGIS